MRKSARGSGRLLMVLGVGGAALVWSRPRAMSEVKVREFRTPARSRVTDVAWSPDGKTLLLGVQHFEPHSPSQSKAQRWDVKSGAQLWDVKIGAPVRTLSPFAGQSQTENRVHFAPDGREVSIDNRIQPLQSGALRVVTEGGGHIGLLFSPDGKMLAGASKDVLLLWNRRDVKPRAMLGDAASIRSRLNSQPYFPFIKLVAWSPDRRFIVTGHTDGRVQLWDVRLGQLARTLGAKGALGSHGVGVNGVAFSPDGRIVAAADARKIVLWDARDGREIKRLAGLNQASMFGLAWSPDGKTLAAGGPHFYPVPWEQRLSSGRQGHLGPRPITKGEINLWDVASGRHKATMQAGKWIIRIAFSPDGKQLATAGTDNTARLWKVPE